MSSNQISTVVEPMPILPTEKVPNENKISTVMDPVPTVQTPKSKSWSDQVEEEFPEDHNSSRNVTEDTISEITEDESDIESDQGLEADLPKETFENGTFRDKFLTDADQPMINRFKDFGIMEVMIYAKFVYGDLLEKAKTDHNQVIVEAFGPRVKAFCELLSRLHYETDIEVCEQLQTLKPDLLAAGMEKTIRIIRLLTSQHIELLKTNPEKIPLIRENQGAVSAKQFVSMQISSHIGVCKKLSKFLTVLYMSGNGLKQYCNGYACGYVFENYGPRNKSYPGNSNTGNDIKPKRIYKKGYQGKNKNFRRSQNDDVNVIRESGHFGKKPSFNRNQEKGNFHGPPHPENNRGKSVVVSDAKPSNPQHSSVKPLPNSSQTKSSQNGSAKSVSNQGKPTSVIRQGNNSKPLPPRK